MMFPFSLFTTIKISDRIESLRDAESKLLDFAKTRFVHSDHSHSFELFDTPIPPPSVLKHTDDTGKKNRKRKCQVFDDVEHYSLHGVKVVNKQLADLEQQTNTQQQRKSPPAPLVLLHGYANGSLYFYRNLHGLSKFFGHVYALDMLGWGLSSRPAFHLNNTKDDTNNYYNNSVKSAEQFFVESLESWRAHHNLPKMTLAGHSMGGYLSVAYAEQYPQHVEKLILLSPVGVPIKVDSEDEQRVNSLPFYVRAMIHTVRAMFNRGITPGYFLRSLPNSKSRAMVHGYITNRLPAITCEEEQQVLGEYLYQNSMLPGSGEDCLCEILTAGAFAKVPLLHRIPEIKSSGGNGEGLEVHFIYGENDWMDWRGGMDVQRLCHQKTQDTKATNNQLSSSSHSPPKVFVHGVRNAGHLLMLENYQEFNAAMAVASGREGDLPPGMPRSVEFICDEVAATASSNTGGGGADKVSFRSSSGMVVMNEKDAAKFFRGGRFNRSESQQKADDNVVVAEEKKE